MQQFQRTARRHPRVRAERPVLVKVLGDPDRADEELTRTRVLGTGGCMFVSQDPPGYLSLLELVIALGNGVVRVDGRVAYTLRRRDGFEVGVEFLRVGPADRQRLAALVANPAAPPASPAAG